jgi:hypothetical protein
VTIVVNFLSENSFRWRARFVLIFNFPYYQFFAFIIPFRETDY